MVHAKNLREYLRKQLDIKRPAYVKELAREVERAPSTVRNALRYLENHKLARRLKHGRSDVWYADSPKLQREHADTKRINAAKAKRAADLAKKLPARGIRCAHDWHGDTSVIIDADDLTALVNAAGKNVKVGAPVSRCGSCGDWLNADQLDEYEECSKCRGDAA